MDIKALAHSYNFQRVVSVIIILCSLTLGIETFFLDHKRVFDIIDILFTAFFVFEIIVRFIADGSVIRFFKFITIRKEDGYKIHFDEHGFWNWFDFIIVVVSIISLFSHLFEHPEFLVVSRLFRVMRVMRLLEVSSELRDVERKIVSIIPTIFSFALLLGVLLYIYSIIGIYLFSHHVYEHADFSNLSAAFLTLFQLMTLDGWSDMMYAASASYDGSWLIKMYFISFVVLTAIISFNVFVAVLTSQVHERFLNEQKQSESKLAKLAGEVSETEREVETGFKEVLAELKSLRKELEDIKNRGNS
jgi:voltage-gated sodium channel